MTTMLYSEFPVTERPTCASLSSILMSDLFMQLYKQQVKSSVNMYGSPERGYSPQHVVYSDLYTVLADFTNQKLRREQYDIGEDSEDEKSGINENIDEDTTSTLKRQLEAQLEIVNRLCIDKKSPLVSSKEGKVALALEKWFQFLSDHGLIKFTSKVVPYLAEMACNISEFDETFNFKTVNEVSANTIFRLKQPINKLEGIGLICHIEKPFTIFSHLALIVQENERFVIFSYKNKEEDLGFELSDEDEDESDTNRCYAIVSENFFNKYNNKRLGWKKLDMISAERLEGLEYSLPLECIAINKEKSYHPFIIKTSVPPTRATDDYATGIFHLSPAFNAEDYQICFRLDLLFRYRLFDPTCDKMLFTDQIEYFKGRESRYCNRDVIKLLHENKCLFESAEVSRSVPYCQILDRLLYNKFLPVCCLDLTPIMSNFIQYLEKVVEDSSLKILLTSYLKENCQIVISSTKTSGITIPGSNKLVFNSFLSSFNPFIAHIHSRRLYQFDNLLTKTRINKWLLVYLYRYLTSAETTPYPLSQIVFEGEVKCETSLLQGPSFYRLKNWDELQTLINDNDLDSVRFGFATMSVYHKNDFLKIDIHRFKECFKRIVKPLTHNMTFFQQYFPLLQCNDFNQCDTPKSVLDNWILHQTILLARSYQLEEDNQIEKFQKMLVSFSEQCGKTVDLVNKSYIRFYRPVLKGQIFTENHHRSLLTLAQVLANLAIICYPYFPTTSLEVYEMVHNLLQIDRPLDQLSFDDMFHPDLDQIDQSCNISQLIISSIKSIIEYRDRESCDMRTPIRRAVFTVESDLIPELTRLRSIVEEETGCLEVTFVESFESFERDKEIKYQTINQDVNQTFILDLTVDEKCNLRSCVKGITGQIQRLRREAGLKMTDAVQVEVTTDAEFIYQAVKSEFEYIERMLLINLKLTLVDELINDHGLFVFKSQSNSHPNKYSISVATHLF